MSGFEAVIGLEIHAQLRTDSKMFCSCETAEYDAAANTAICPVCTGQPGALPVANKKAVELGVKAGLVLNARINPMSVFARKNYFYPDLPKSYQISQFEKPLCEDGSAEIVLETGARKTIRIKRAHLEEDAGKSLHAIGSRQLDHTLIDFNRCGAPLIEIVSEPDMNSAEEAYAYLTELKQLIRWASVSGCDMEKGELRCDVNVSIRPIGAKELGKKVEIKNLNSFKAVKDAVSHEISRQTAAALKGEIIAQDTRLWNEKEQRTVPMRSKEMAHDYRYFPEPDLVPLRLDKAAIDKIREEIGELPRQRKERFVRDLGLSDYDASVITGTKELSAYFELCIEKNKALKLNAPAKTIANILNSEFLAKMNEEKIDPSSVGPDGRGVIAPANLARLAWLISSGKVSASAAKPVFAKSWETGKDPETLLDELGLAQVSDEGQIEQWAREAIEANPAAAADFRKGNEKALGPIVGTIMKKSKGKANPQLANSVIKKLLLV